MFQRSSRSTSPVTPFKMSVSCSYSSPPLLILSMSITLLSISIAFLSYSIISCQKRDIAEFISGSSDTLRIDGQSCHPSKEDEKRQSGSPRVISASMGPLEGDEEPTIVTPGSGVSGNSGALSNAVASRKNEEEEEDEKALIISNLRGDDGPGRSPKHDDGQEDAPSINTISIEDVALPKPTYEKRSNAGIPPISNPASDAPKSNRQFRFTSSRRGSTGNITSPVNKFTSGGSVKHWYCGQCLQGPMTIGLDTHCNQCWKRRDVYGRPPFSLPRR